MEAIARVVRISPNVVDKANELVRRSESKRSFCMEQTCLIAVCIDLACGILSEPVNKVIKGAGLDWYCCYHCHAYRSDCNDTVEHKQRRMQEIYK